MGAAAVVVSTAVVTGVGTGVGTAGRSAAAVAGSQQATTIAEAGIHRPANNRAHILERR
jgi:hypothetical protein